jgi:DNA polymerase-3 subunit delta'
VDFLSADALPWLAPAQRRLRESLLALRLPHSTLLLSAPGLGAEHLAGWMAALALCDAAAEARPCGACASCALLRSASHPDFHLVQLAEDAKQIKVDQVRELIDALALKSYRGGYKVAIIEGAETLNANGANAFLKTLEEPAPDTLLVLIARPTHRLPATIASRCLKVVLRPPDLQPALTWLKEHGAALDDQWGPALALAGGAPLLALQYHEVGMATLDGEMQEGVRAMAVGAVDVTLLAEQWAKGHVALRIAWLENWITQQVHTLLAPAGSPQSAERVRLPGSLLKPKIRALFELLDCARELRRLASTGINQQLALEALLLGGRTAFVS